MILAVDIGNTNIVLGVCDTDSGRPTWKPHWRLRTVRNRTADELGMYLTGLLRETHLENRITHVIICSVVPQLTLTFEHMIREYLHCDPFIINGETDLGIVNGTDFPLQVGTDRLVNTLAAYTRYQTACIVIDMGTATKLDVITAQGEMLGGVISPGLSITADALYQRAAKLSQVDLVAPPSPLGRNTVHAIQSGLIFGYVSLVEGLIPRLKREIQAHDPSSTEIKIIGTGGLITQLSTHTDIFDEIDPWLTLDGIYLVAQRNLSL